MMAVIEVSRIPHAAIQIHFSVVFKTTTRRQREEVEERSAVPENPTSADGECTKMMKNNRLLNRICLDIGKHQLETISEQCSKFGHWRKSSMPILVL